MKLKIENYLDTIQNNYKSYNTNTAIKDELNAYLKKNFKNAVRDSILSDLPFKLDKVEKCNNKYVLGLEHSLTSKYYDRGILSDFEIDLYAEIDEKTAKGLTEEKFYLVDVEFKEYISFQNNKRYCAYVLMSPFIGFGSGISDNEIQFGAIGVKLKNIRPFIK